MVLSLEPESVGTSSCWASNKRVITVTNFCSAPTHAVEKRTLVHKWAFSLSCLSLCLSLHVYILFSSKKYWKMSYIKLRTIEWGSDSDRVIISTLPLTMVHHAYLLYLSRDHFAFSREKHAGNVQQDKLYSLYAYTRMKGPISCFTNLPGFEGTFQECITEGFSCSAEGDYSPSFSGSFSNIRPFPMKINTLPTIKPWKANIYTYFHNYLYHRFLLASRGWKR